MTLPSLVTDRIAIARLAHRARQYRCPGLDAAVAKVQAAAGSAAVNQLRRRVEPVYRRDPTSAAKYARPRHWILLNTLRVAGVGLHTTSGLRILDIGCGPAYFLALARALGHDAHGVDAPESILSPVERDVYDTLIGVFECGRVVSPLLIERFKPLPFREQPFDLITAYWVCFNRHRQPDEWGREEWRFFVEDALACLRPGGRIVLELVEVPERYGALRFYDEPTLDLFRSAGTVERGRVVIPRP